MNQTYQTLIAIAIVVGAFFLGRSTTPTPDADMFKGWNKTDSTTYTVGNTFRRSINGESVKFLTLTQPTEQYVEPWDAPEIFRPIQYSFDSELTPIVCKWVENEYLIKNCHRICPIDGKTYWMKLDVMEQSTTAPSEARKTNPKEWGEVAN